jgi:hypothetical protein
MAAIQLGGEITGALICVTQLNTFFKLFSSLKFLITSNFIFFYLACLHFRLQKNSEFYKIGANPF